MPPPNEEDAIKIIMGIKEKYEKFHAVSYTDDAIPFSVRTAVYSGSVPAR